MIVTLGQFQFGLFLIGSRPAIGVVGQNLFAVEEHLDAVVAAQRHTHLLGVRRLHRAIKIGRTLLRQTDGVHLAILILAGLPLFAAVFLFQINPFFRAKILVERLIAVLRAKTAEELPTAELRRVRHLAHAIISDPFVHLLQRRLGLGPLRLGQLQRRTAVLQFLVLLHGRHLDHRRGVAVARLHALVRVDVEIGVKLIVLLLRNRIVLVVVALRAFHRQTKPDIGGRLDPVDVVFHTVLFVDRPALVGRAMVAVEPGSHLLRKRGILQLIPCQLLNGEIIETLVVVVGVDRPVAPRPHEAHAVVVVNA